MTTNAPLNFETNPGTVLSIEATDEDGEAATVEFTVSVSDVNEPPAAGDPPSFSLARTTDRHGGRRRLGD